MMADIKVYGTTWCPDCRQAKIFLEEKMIDYEWIDVDQDVEGATLVMQKNGGKRIVPTIVFSDGSFLVEPNNQELAVKLDLTD